MDSLHNRIPSLSNTPYYSLRRSEIGCPINREQFLMRNISIKLCHYSTGSVYHRNDDIQNFAVHESFAATISNSKIKLWNIETCKSLWKFKITPKPLFPHRFDIFNIVGRCLVVSSQEKRSEPEELDTVFIIDLETGKKIHSFKKENLASRVALSGNRLFEREDEEEKIIEYDLDGDIIAVFDKEKLRADTPRSAEVMRFEDLETKDRLLLGSDKYFVDIDQDGFFFINKQTGEAKFISLKLGELGFGQGCLEYQSSHIYEQYLFIGIQARSYKNKTEESNNYIYVYDLDNQSRKWLPCKNSLRGVTNIRFNGDKLCFNIGCDVAIVDAISSNLTKIKLKDIKDLSSDGKILILAGVRTEESGYHLYDLIGMKFITEFPISRTIQESKTLLEDGIFYTNDLKNLLKYNLNLITSPEIDTPDFPPSSPSYSPSYSPSSLDDFFFPITTPDFSNISDYDYYDSHEGF